MNIKKLEWDDKYSVGVAQIDDQHKLIFSAINELFDVINTNDPEKYLKGVVDELLKYKNIHFATEEKYFEMFNYEGTKKHEERHKQFSEELEALIEKYPKYTMEFAFELVDFVENWLIDHIMNTDQKYKECFKSHGLK